MCHCRQPSQNRVPAYEIVDVSDGINAGEAPFPHAISKDSNTHQQEQVDLHVLCTPQEYLTPVRLNIQQQGHKTTRMHATATRKGKDFTLKEGDNTYQALQPVTVDAASEYQSLTHRVQPTEQDDVPPALPPKPGKKM